MLGNDAKLARVRRILQRQSKPAWGKAYVPSIRATPAEAPRCSRPTILRPAKLGLRDMHLLSNPEAAAAILALYHPSVWDSAAHTLRLIGQTTRETSDDTAQGIKAAAS